MIAALIVLAVAYVATVAAFAYILVTRDRAERSERAITLDRIQDPEGVRSARIIRDLESIPTQDETPPPPEQPRSSAGMLIDELTGELF